MISIEASIEISVVYCSNILVKVWNRIADTQEINKKYSMCAKNSIIFGEYSRV